MEPMISIKTSDATVTKRVLTKLCTSGTVPNTVA
jgi:hypothetical protein